MAKSDDFLCDLCGEFTSLQDNPLAVIVYAEQPGDRVGTTYDMAQLHPFMAYVSAMHVPRFEACELCCFHATVDPVTKTRTGPPIFTADVTHPAIRAYFDRHGAALDAPGLTQAHRAQAQRAAAVAAQITPPMASPVVAPIAPPADSGDSSEAVPSPAPRP